MRIFQGRGAKPFSLGLLSSTVWKSISGIGNSALLLALSCWVMLSYPLLANDLIAYSRGLLATLALAMLSFSIWRFSHVQLMRLPLFRRRAVVVGLSTGGLEIVNELRKTGNPAVRILGYIDERLDERLQQDGLAVLGGMSKLRDMVRAGMIDMIIMAMDYSTHPGLFQEVVDAASLGILVLPMTIVYERASGQIPVEHIGDQWYVALPMERNLSLFYLCWQKFLDLFFGLLGVLALLIIFPVVALCISLDSPGPILYRQERLGYRGRPFTILKFRSMQTNAEQQGQAVWASEGDARVTRVGRLLRSTHLDELPQALNILCGEMSLIGPRPEREVFVTELEKTIPFYRCRLSVKPGLTGWAQVQYRYTNTTAETLRKLQYDLYYIKHQSLALDLMIILKTIIGVLSRQGT